MSNNTWVFPVTMFAPTDLLFSALGFGAGAAQNEVDSEDQILHPAPVYTF